MEKEPIRIAHVVGQVVMGGVDAVVMNYYRHIDKTKFQFDFFMDGLGETPFDNEILSLGGHIYKLPSYEDSMSKNLKVFRKIIKENNYTIIHCHMNTLSVFWLREAKKADIPVRIAHSHSTAGKGEFARNILKYTLRPFSKRYANQFCACSEHAGRWLFGDRFYNTGKVKLIRNAIDVEKFAYNEEIRTEMRKELGIDDKFVVGHVGRFMYQKNHEFLIEIFAELNKQKTDSVLLLVGDGPRREKIEKLVESKGLQDKVIFTGNRSDVQRFLQAMDCFVLPSRYEGLGMVLIEAQAAGLPCVISDKVPESAMMTDICTQVLLDETPTVWAKAVFVCYKKRIDYNSRIKKMGYDVAIAAKELKKQYEKLHRGIQ